MPFESLKPFKVCQIIKLADVNGKFEEQAGVVNDKQNEEETRTERKIARFQEKPGKIA